MSEIYFRQGPGNRPTATSTENPFPVQVVGDHIQPPVAGQTITRTIQVPGIGAASAYQDGDAFGTLITFKDVFREEKRSGTVVSVIFHDLDDEGIQKDVPLFIAPISTTTDNNAFTPSDADNLLCRGVVSVSDFKNWGSNQIGQALNVGLWINGNDTNLYTQLVTRGADNITAGQVPWISLVVVPD